MKTSTSISNRQDETDRLFVVPVRNEAGYCSEAGCSCGNTVILKDSGYLYIRQKVVDFRKDCPTPKALLYKLNKRQADQGCFETVALDKGAIYPSMLCRQAAIRHQLDLEIARQDAAHWWQTGKVPLRSTPTSFSN